MLLLAPKLLPFSAYVECLIVSLLLQSGGEEEREPEPEPEREYTPAGRALKAKL